MRVLFRATTSLIQRARADLARPHEFAAERIGWLSTKAAVAGDTLLLLGLDYHSISDSDYVRDPSIGARIGEDAITQSLNLALRQRAGIFNIHSHGGNGTPLFSQTDVHEHPNLVSSLLPVQGAFPHGALLFSDDQLAGLVWLSRNRAREIDEVQIVGARNNVFRPGRSLR